VKAGEREEGRRRGPTEVHQRKRPNRKYLVSYGGNSINLMIVPEQSKEVPGQWRVVFCVKKMKRGGGKKKLEDFHQRN